MKHEPAYLEIYLTRLAFSCAAGPSTGHLQTVCLLAAGSGCSISGAAWERLRTTPQKLPRGHLTCLDISGRWLKACRKTLRGFENITYLQWGSSPLTNESFDLVYCHFVLHDIAESELERTVPALAQSSNPAARRFPRTVE